MSLSLGLTAHFKQPSENWNQRAAKVVSMSQAQLDEDLWIEDESIKGGVDFTTQGFGVLADVVNGGLKTDLSLGFEMPDADFAREEMGWCQKSVPCEKRSSRGAGKILKFRPAPHF